MSYTLQLDYDDHGFPEFNMSELLDLVRMDARRFIEYPEMGGTIVIKQSEHGYHLRAPFARLTEHEQMLATILSYAADSGYKYWTETHRRSTLRIGPKVIVKQIGDRLVGSRIDSSTPRVIEVIKK